MTESISRHLGQNSAYKKEYDPSLLVRENRQSNRTYLGIDSANPPFEGHDIWNAYEVSALNDNGLPYSFVVRIAYSSNNEFIVESKSLKLYYNSYAMTKCGESADDVALTIKERSEKDLGALLETSVKVTVWNQRELMDSTPALIEDAYNLERYTTLEHIEGAEHITFKDYSENPDLLVVIDDDMDQWRDYHSSSLVSCCKVTSQPDSGDIFISYLGPKTVSPESLLQYIVSFRNENHFHEEICEAVFMRLLEKLQPESLIVRCFYSRRGGIDINPSRYYDKGDNIEISGFDDEETAEPVKLPRQ